MISYLKKTAVLLVLLFFYQNALAQTRFEAFRYNNQISYAPKVAGDPERRYLDVNPELLNKNNVSLGDIITIQHEGREFDFRVKKTQSFVEDTYTIVASMGTRYLYFTIHGDIVTATIHLPEIEYEGIIYYDHSFKKSYLFEHDHTTELSCELDQYSGFIQNQIDNKLEIRRINNATDLVQKVQGQNAQTTITLMIVYTNGAMSWMNSNGSVNTVVNTAMALTQEAMDVSNTEITLDLVHVANVNYNEADVSSSDILSFLRINGDGIMDEVHAWRDTYEADIVSLFAQVDDTGGLGYLITSSYGAPNFAFNLNRVQQITGTYTLVHEIGHNLGNNHSRNQAASAAGASGGVFVYSTGWRWIGTDAKSYASVMTYETSPLDAVNSLRTPHFSNPNINYQGTPTGTTSSSVPFGPADNARSMREMKDVTASYRPLTAAQPPIITSISPTTAVRGTQVTVVFTGQNFGTINSIGWCSESVLDYVGGAINYTTQATITWNVLPAAALGPCNLQLQSPVGNSNLVPLTILAASATSPTVTTATVTSIASSSATSGGNVTSDGGASVTARGVCYATTQNPTTADQCVSSGSGTGTFTASLTSLSSGTLYYVRAYATNTAGTAYGSEVSFTTATAVVAPTLTTAAVTSIGTTTATGGGTVTDAGSSAVSARGVCYATTQNPTTADQCVSSGSGTGTFTASLTSLSSGTLYYVRAYATNTAGTAYGSQVSFTTQSPFVNKRPTMNVIGDVSFLHTAAEQVVNLSGISAGEGENQNLTVTAVAANTKLIQSLSVQYVNQQATGTIRFQNDRQQVGTTTISVRVKDDAGTANGGVDSLVVSFVVNVLLDTDLGDENATPNEYRLDQNYPNPFNPSTQISFSMPSREMVRFAIYDIMGKQRLLLLNSEMAAGIHTVTVDARSLTSGIYMYVLRSGNFKASKKMTLIK